MLTYQLCGFNNNITTTSFHHSSDKSTILKKIFDAGIFFYIGTNLSDVTARPGSKRQLTSYSALHLGEWAAKIQIFGFTYLLNAFT